MCARKTDLKLIQSLRRVLRSSPGEELDMNPVIFLQRVFWLQIVNSLVKRIAVLEAYGDDCPIWRVEVQR